jgi:hypothetical protein
MAQFFILSLFKQNHRRMKNRLLLLCAMVLTGTALRSQCVFSCYTYTRTSIAYSVFPNAGNNAIPQFAPSIDDGITPPIPLGFNFNYYCGTYSAVLVCSNGFIQFDIGSPPSLAFSNPAQAFPDPASPNGIVALNMNDFDPNYGGIITYTTIGSAPNRMFIATYSNVPIWTYNSSLNTGQIVLYEGSDIIEIHSGSINASNTNIYNGTQGIENPTGTSGNTVPGRSASVWQVTTSDAYRWTPVAQYTAAPMSGTISGPTSVCQGQPGNFNLTTTVVPNQFNWTVPGNWTGTSTTTALAATIGATGVVSVTATYSCGNTPPLTFSVTSLPLPNITITGVTPAFICSGETMTIDVTGGATYTLFPGGIPVNSSFTVQPPGPMTYSVAGTGTNGCESAYMAQTPVTVYQTPTVVVNSGTICIGETFTINATGANIYTYCGPFNTVKPVTVGTTTCMVIGQAANNCTASAVTTVEAKPLPTLTLTASRTSLCPKETITLSVTGANSYTWTNNLSSATSSAITMTVSPLANTNYSVTGTDQFSCSSTSTVGITLKVCTGLDESLSGVPYTVYPNPSAGVFNVSFVSYAPGAKLDVLDGQGRRIATAEPVDGKAVIDLGAHAAGIYFLQLRGTPGVQKIVKE